MTSLTIKFFIVLLLPMSIFATDWQKLTRLDLKATYQYLKKDSAGGADQQNPTYTHWLKAGLKKSLVLSNKVKTASSYNLVMNYYTNGFHDEHVIYMPFLKRFEFPVLWPGFTVFYTQHGVYVSSLARNHAQKKLPPKNAELISCDGIMTKQLLLQRVFPYFGNPKLNASWHIVTPRLFFYSSNPWFKSLKQCRFKVGNKTEIYTLRWQKISNTQARSLRLTANYNYEGHYAAKNFGNNNVWVSIPSFLPKNKTRIQKLNQLIQAAKTWRNHHLIVFDMRGNLGGNSVWGTRLLESLYGKAFYDQQLSRLAPAVYQWRVSKDNIDELSGFYSHYVKANFGEHSFTYQHLQKTIQGMLHAKQLHEAYYPLRVKKPKSFAITTTVHNPVKAKIIWLTDGRCASSCLTFGDELFTFPNVIQAGQATHAATDYTDSVLVTLPSGASLYYPMKVQRYRQRGNNVPYVPARSFYYKGDINDTGKVQRWLKHKVKSS